jgi:2',3'-cyclic-nucleotide 2'-phosphodiesterase (5'-nucleotidase family)
MFNKIRTIGKIAKTVSSPITHARNVISSAFKKKPKFNKKEEAAKYRKKALKMTKDATARVTKEMKSKEKVIGEKAAKEIGNTTKSKMMKDYLKYNRDLSSKAKGGRIGYKGGKLVGNQKKIDVAPPFGTINKKDFKVLQAKNKNKKKVI